MKHEHRCGADVFVLQECIGAGDGRDGSSFRTAFRDSNFHEVHLCPGCGQGLLQAWHDRELRCIDECADPA